MLFDDDDEKADRKSGAESKRGVDSEASAVLLQPRACNQRWGKPCKECDHTCK